MKLVLSWLPTSALPYLLECSAVRVEILSLDTLGRGDWTPTILLPFAAALASGFVAVPARMRHSAAALAGTYLLECSAVLAEILSLDTLGRGDRTPRTSAAALVQPSLEAASEVQAHPLQ